MATLQKTTGVIAKSICKQISDHIGATWSDSPAQWWSNIFNNAQTINSFFTELVNVIIEQRIKADSFENPLNRYKSGELPLGLGDTVIYFNPQTGRDFTTKPDDMQNHIVNWKDNNAARNRNYGIFLDVLPDVKQVFFRLNFGKQYKLTYSDIELNNVMTTWNSVGEFIDAISRNLTASANIEEYQAMRDLFANGYEQGFIPIQPISEITDQATGDAFLVQARKYYNQFKFPSENYTGWNAKNPEAKVKTWTNPEKISIVLTPQTSAVVDVMSLSKAFNMDKADMIGRTQIVDTLDENGKVAAILFDDALLHVRPKVEQFGAFFNPDTIKQSIYLTRTGIMALDPFANAVAFTTDTFTALAEQPDDWATDYTNYYVKVGTTYTRLGEYSEAPEFAAGTYYEKD